MFTSVVVNPEECVQYLNLTLLMLEPVYLHLKVRLVDFFFFTLCWKWCEFLGLFTYSQRHWVFASVYLQLIVRMLGSVYLRANTMGVYSCFPTANVTNGLFTYSRRRGPRSPSCSTPLLLHLLPHAPDNIRACSSSLTEVLPSRHVSHTLSFNQVNSVLPSAKMQHYFG